LTVATKAELESLVARQTEALKSQLARIAELEGEVARLNGIIEGSCDALQTLQQIYTDRGNPVSVIIKAASEAVNYERPRQPTVILNPMAGFAERLGASRQEYLSRIRVVNGVSLEPGDDGYPEDAAPDDTAD
jgi:hypothetical protein